MSELATADLVVGVFLISFPSVVGVVYGFTLYAIWKDKDLRKHTCYKFMILLGIADIGQLLLHVVGGVMTVCQGTGPWWVDVILGASLGQGLWNVGVAYIHLLAFNRFLSVASPTVYKKLFGIKGTKVFATIPWLIGLGITSWSMAEKAFGFSHYSFTWYFDFSLPDSAASLRLFKWIDWFLIASQVFLSIGWYILLFIAIQVQRMSHGSTSQSPATAGAKAAERSASISAGLICGVLILEYFFFNHISPKLPASRWSYFGSAIAWLANAAVNPLIYLSLNRTTRNVFLGRVKTVAQQSGLVQSTASKSKVYPLDKSHTRNKMSNAPSSIKY